MKHLIKTMAFTLLGLVLSSNLWAASATYTQVTDASSLKAGDVIVLGCADKGKAAGAMGSNSYLASEDATFKNGVMTSSKAIEITLGGSAGAWTLTTSEGQITTSAAKALKKNDGTQKTWTISFKDGTATITGGSYGVIQYNSSSPRFLNYTSDQTAIEIYKKDIADPVGKDVSITADSELNLTSEESDGTITVTYGEDVADKDIYLYNDAECTSSFTGDWFTADFDASGNVEYMASANTGAAREAYIQIYVIADDAETDNTKVIKVTQAKYAAPTGTFEKFTGDLEEGDYVITSQKSGETKAAMKAELTTTSTKRMVGVDIASVLSDDKITNPDVSTIWHIAPDASNDGYWNIYNEDAGVYAAFTSSNGAAALLQPSNLSDYGRWQMDDNKEFTNKGKTDKYLRYNKDVSAFASYATTTGATLTLYQKVLPPTNEAVTFAAPEGGSLVIKNGETPIASGTTIQNGTVLDVTFGMTPAEAYKDVAIKVTKTEGGDDVTSTVYDATKKQITMPRYAITVAVTSTKLYKISLVTAGEGTGSATMNGVTTDIYVDDETQIDLVANAVAPNEFTKWSATEKIAIAKEGDAETYAFASGDGTITATFGVSALLPLEAPTLSAPTNVTYNSVTLNWQELANAEGGYNVEILLNDETVVFESSIGETSWTPDFTFQANTTYTYTVQGVGDGSTYAEENNPKAQSTFTTADYPAATLTLSENGETRDIVGKLNTPIDLPTTSTQACDGKVFVGWSASPIDGEVDAEPSLLGATYTFTNPEQLTATIYAVYAKEEKGTTTWNIATSIVAGDVIVFSTNTSSDYRYTAQTIASNIMPCAASTYSDDKSQITTLGDGTQQYTVGGNSENGFTFATAGGYLYISADKKVDVKNTATTWSCSINESTKAATISQKLNSDTYYLKFNPNVQSGVSTNPRFTVYKSGQQDIVLYKKTTGASSYSNYCTTCQAAVAAPTFSLAEGSYTSAQTLTLSAAEGDIYYTINDGEETKYTAAIALNNRGTYEISAYAKVDERTSETITKTYTLNWAYTLAELVAEGAPTSTGRTVTVILENEVIESLATSGDYVNGFFTMVGDKKIEVYCKNSPSEWEVGGKVSGTVTCPWKDYQGTWELCPTNWNWASYTAPAKITSLVITGDVTNKEYTAGQKLDFTGLTVTGVYSDNTEQVSHKEDVTADVAWTEVTLTENQIEATATATLNSVKTGSQDVSESKTITGLTVGAKVELSKIEITTEASKKDFFVGRNFNHDGIVVTATYSNGSTSNVTNACDFSTPTLENKGQETVTITYSEGEGQDKKEVTTSYTINVTYMNLSELVAEDVPTNTSVKVAFSDVEITGFYTNKSEQRTGVYVNVIGKNGSNIELYSGGTPSETLNGWQEGGKLASKSDYYITGTWKYFDGGSVWEIDFGSNYAWATNIEYTAPSIYPTGIAMSIPSAMVKQSKSLDLDAIFTPANATVLNNLAWESDNTKVTVVPSQDKKSATVTIAPDATVGTATITVKVDDKDGNKLSATCVITIQEYSVPRYGLYNGAISEGDYIFKADGGYYFMNNTISSSRLTNVANADDPNIVNNVITTDAEAYVWHIAKSGDYWTIQNLANNKYAAGTGSKNQAQLLDACTDNMAKWTITYDEENEVYTFENFGRSQASSDKENKYLRNNDNSGWACYQSGTGNAITLYKAGFTPAAALQSIEIQGNLDITEYFLGKSVKYDGLTVEGTYSDASKKTITEGIEWSASPASFSNLGAQTVTITATVTTKSGDVTDDAEFNVTVVESQKVSYGLVTSVNTLYDGASIILGAVFGTATDPIYAVNQGFDTKYLAAYRSNTEGSDLEYENEVMKTAYASEITLKKVEGGWKLMDENNNYIKSNNADIALTDKAEEATVWTITIEEDVAKIASGSNIIYYNTSSPRFKTYTSEQQEIGIYMKNLLPVRTGLTIGQYTTYCEPYAVVAGSYSGATFWNIADKTYMSDNQRLYSITIEQHLGDLEAGVPYIMLPEDAQLTGVKYGEAVDAPAAEDAHNGLVGVFETTMFDDVFGTVADDAEAAERGIYIISDGTLYLCGNYCGVYGNRAYILRDQINPMPLSGAPRRVIGNPNGTPTTLNGIFGNQSIKAQKALIDGNIYILRNNKMYNAQGQFVK